MASLCLFAVAAGVSPAAVAQSPACRSESAAVRLDHVVVAVRDLDSVTSSFQDRLGFSLKPGRVHANGLRNAHIRFADGSALELISVGEGEPDELSEWYARFVAEGEGGAFVALRAGPPDSVLLRLGELALEARVLEGRAFDWVSFPAAHPLHAVFFIHVRSRPPDAPGYIIHENGATGLSEVWLESAEPQMLTEVLVALGATRCGRLGGAGELSRIGLGLAGGTLAIVPAASKRRVQSRVRLVVLSGDRNMPGVSASGVRIEWVERGP